MKSLRNSRFQQLLSNALTPSSWSLPSFVPHAIRRRIRSSRSKLRSRTSPSSSITTLDTSFSPLDTLETIRTHQWSLWDAQYLLFAAIGIFALCFIEHPGPWVIRGVGCLLLTSLAIPVTRQFFLPILPVISWLVLFYTAQFVNAEYRPPIWVRVLPALENIFYGANLSNILSAHKSTALDVLAWLPYGITHFGAPVVCSIIMFIFGPPGIVPTFARTFGYMNIFGVCIQLCFPCSPPWYENMYGLAPATYAIKGSPAGLAAVDKLFGIDLYTSTFTASPLVFGAFPSLHAGSATTEALFMSYVFPKLRPLFAIYALWLCWATMYLSHHYAVDLVGGALLATVCFYFSKANFLPKMQYDKFLRWDYDYVEVGELPLSSKEKEYEGRQPHLSSSFSSDTTLSHTYSDDYDEEARLSSLLHPGAKLGVKGAMPWSLGSSSSYSSQAGSLGDRSPVSGEERDSWEVETLAGGSDHEKR